MDIQTVLLIVSIVLFVVGGVFVAVAVRVYFKLDIRNVRADLSGKARSREIAEKNAKKRPQGEEKSSHGGIKLRGKQTRQAKGDSAKRQESQAVGKQNRREGPVEKTRKRQANGYAASPPQEPLQRDSKQRAEAPTSAMRQSEVPAQKETGGTGHQPVVKEIEFRLVRRIVLTDADIASRELRE